MARGFANADNSGSFTRPGNRPRTHGLTLNYTFGAM